MRTETAERFLELLRDQINSDAGQVIVYKMVSQMSDREAAILADEMEDMTMYPDFMTEKEAKEVTASFQNFDGSKGPHWREPDAMFDAVRSLGIPCEKEGHYNRWSWYTTMNMIWSDEWGVLRNYVSNGDEVKAIAELTQARLLDRDRVFSVRRYFRLDQD